MALGAYSIVRYSDHLSDQRVNLGVLVWHPLDGFAFRFTPSFDRIKAVDPRVHVEPMRQQVEIIKAQLGGTSHFGSDVLKQLSREFKEGLEVTAPYPAKIRGMDEIVEHLYLRLVSPVEEFRRASTQKKFSQSFVRTLAASMKDLVKDPSTHIKSIGTRRISGLPVDVGIRATMKGYKALWRTISFQSQDKPDLQLAGAKSAAMDISVLREQADYRDDKQFVALQPPKVRASERFKDSLAWLEKYADKVYVVSDSETFSAELRADLRAAAH